MNYKHLLLAAASGAMLYSGNAAAQSVKNYGCGTDEHNAYLDQMYPQGVQIRQAVEKFTQQYMLANKNNKISAPLLKIPVVVHVVTLNGMSGMPKAQVLNGIQILKEDFRRTNADAGNTRLVFQPYAADFEVDFELARLDPNGNPTEGINRVSTFTANSTLSAYPISREEVKKAAPAWPTDKYFNIWLIEAWDNTGFPGGSLLGYAQFPGSGSWDTYGLVMLGTQWGKAGAVPGSTATTDGRTATHEVGHNLNLYHTFQGGCGNQPGGVPGDGCGDTPPQANDTQACNLNQNSCSNDVGPNSPYTSNVNDQIENYMSYDNCQNMFTEDQKTRSRAAFAAHSRLQNLVSAGNATVTGVDPNVTIGPLLPVPYFAANKTYVCAGNTVTFTDLSYNGPAATAWNWSFPGGSPASSTDQNPVVTYATPGKYPVTLTSTNTNGASQPVTATNYITVVPTTGLVSVSPGVEYLESFEDPGFPANSGTNRAVERTSTTLDPGTPNWEQTLSAATHGNYSLRLRNNSIVVTGTKSILITPNIDISSVPINSIRATIDVAYAMKNSTSKDELRISYSLDCGDTWIPRRTLSGAGLASNGAGNYVAGNFTPSASQWKLDVNVPAINGTSNGTIMFKIEGITMNSNSNSNNSLYIDNFKVWTIATGVGVNEDLAAKNNIQVYPNPVTSETGVSFELHKAEKVAVKIFDLVGNMIYEGPASTMQSGTHTISISDKMKNVSAGMYMLQLTMGNQNFNTKLIAK